MRARNLVASRRFVVEALEVGCQNLLVSTAVVKNPVVHAPLPPVEGGVVLDVAEGYPDDVVFGGLVFVDGSCDRPPVKDLNRAV